MLTSLKAILRGAARSLGVERAANAALIEEMWPDVVGAEAAAHTRTLGLRGTVLLAEAEIGPWAQELSAQRARFIREINRRLGGEILTEIRFGQTTAALSPLRPKDGGGPTVTDAAELSTEELLAVEQAVAQIADPDVREAARKAMASQLRWRKGTGRGP